MRWDHPASLDTRHVARAYDNWKREPGAFDSAFRKLLTGITPRHVAEICQAYDLSADEIMLEKGALCSARRFEAFYTRAFQKMHERALGLTGFTPPAWIACWQAEQALNATFPGGRGEALDVARREGLRRIVVLIRDHAKRSIVDQLIRMAVARQYDMPATFQHQVIGLLKDSLGFRQLRRANE